MFHSMRPQWAKIPLSLALVAAACAPQWALAGCKSGATRMQEILGNRSTPDVLVLAHRGLWDDKVPENSREALRQAQNACMDGVEFDIKVTKDGVALLMHDFNLGRTTDVNAALGGARYNPYNNTGTNPSVSSLNWNQISGLNLLTKDRRGVTNQRVPALSDVFDYWNSNHMSIPMVFDTKDAGAVRAVSALAGNKFGNNANNVVAVKVNATLFPYPSNFLANAKNITAIPVFTTNMLSKINLPDSRKSWQDWANTLEINVKQDGGLLHGQMKEAQQAGNRVGVFQAIPDAGGDQFFSNDGHCCYRLKDLYSSYQGKSDTDDKRGDFGYLSYMGFGLITTDDPRGTIYNLAQQGKRRDHQ